MKMPHCWKSHIAAQLFTAVAVYDDSDKVRPVAPPDSYACSFEVCLHAYVIRTVTNELAQLFSIQ